MKYISPLLIILLSGFLGLTFACIELNAGSSYDTIVVSNYNNYEDECWIIDAGAGNIVSAYSTYLGLELYCSDEVEVRCNGANGPLIDTYCGGDYIYDIYSSERKMYIRFTSDYSVTSTGFTIYYKAESSSHSASCSDYSGSGSVAVGLIVGITVGIIVLIVIAVVVIIVCNVQKANNRRVNPIVTSNTYGRTAPIANTQLVQPPAYGMQQGGGYGGNWMQQQPQQMIPPPPSYNAAQQYPPPQQPANLYGDPAYPQSGAYPAY